MTIAAGSAKELEYQALLAYDLGLLSLAQFERLNSETVAVARMLTALIHRTRAAAEVRDRLATTNYQLPTTN